MRTLAGMIKSQLVAKIRPWLDQRWNRVPDVVRRSIQQARTRPGHFYSPFPDLDELSTRADEVFAPRATFPGIDLRVDAQLARLDEFATLAADFPWADNAKPSLRYQYANRPYAHGDGLFTAAMLSQLRPRRLVEIGSGYSTMLALDVRDRLIASDPDVLHITSVDPYPQRLRELLGAERPERFTIIEQTAQQLDVAVIDSLTAGDVLLIDSTHVAKAGSDVNHIFFELVPRVAPGVLVHVHDVFANFEYPREWVFQRRAWSEAYLLRAFLQFNAAFEVEFWGAWLVEHQRDRVVAHGDVFAPALINPGASIWLRRTSDRGATG